MGAHSPLARDGSHGDRGHRRRRARGLWRRGGAIGSRLASPISSSTRRTRVAASAKQSCARCSATRRSSRLRRRTIRARSRCTPARACSPYGRITSCSAIRGRCSLPRRSQSSAAERDELVEIDREATGFDRAIDHEYYEVGCRAQPLRVVSDGRAIGFAYLEPPQPWATNRWILLTLAVVPGFESGDAVCAALAHAGAQGADRLFTAVGGPNPVLQRLLASGFVIPEQDIYMATSPDITDPLRHHPHPGFG